MALRSPHVGDEEWCLVSDNEDSNRSLASSDDEVEPEPEFVPRYTASAIPLHTSSVAKEDSVDIEGLLGDVSEFQREKAYPREVRISLLSPEHRDNVQGRSEASSKEDLPPVISVKVAFTFPDMTSKKSFPDRLRATVEAFRPLPVANEKCLPAHTPVETVALEASTQTEFLEQVASAPLPEALSRASLFRAALDRSLALTAQLHAKSQECERVSHQMMELQRRLEVSEATNRENEIKLQRCQRSMAIANDRQNLSTQYEGHHRGIIADLATENRTLIHQNAVLSGLEPNLSGESVLKLEALESALARAMENVRFSLRAKYRSAINSVTRMESSFQQPTADYSNDDGQCVVCLSQLASVRLVPCDHKILCPACAVRVDKCPIDRQSIKDKVLTFGLNAYTQTE